MMRVPRSARPSTMYVKVPREGGYGGEFEQPVEVRRVRFEPVSAWLRPAARSAPVPTTGNWR